MLITDTYKLNDFKSEYRLWQGVPSITITHKGRIFLTFYSGGTTEQIGNYVVLLKSDDGKNFGEPVAVAFEEGHRCYDPCLWTDPIGRLWFTWSYAPNNAVYAVICNNPDADEIIWSKERIIGNDVMMNKPTVLSTGEWLFPMAVWNHGVRVLDGKYDTSDTSDDDRGSFVYKTIDNGLSFEKFGGADVKDKSYDEHMVIELKDGNLAMFVRTNYGIGVSYSFDKGRTWREEKDSGLGEPCSRFFISRLKSGRILLINHHHFKGRNNLTAMLSEDECKTWKYTLLLDERDFVSYPDAVESEDGYIYITYDRERGSGLNSLEAAYSQAREIVIDKITENDIINGEIIDSGSYIKRVASKLGKYALESKNLYNEINRFSNSELVELLSSKTAEDIINYIFEGYRINCLNMHKIDNQKLDSLVESLKAETRNKSEVILEIILLVRSVTDSENATTPIIERIKETIKRNLSNNLSLDELACEIGISKYYMCHLFTKSMGISINNYLKALRLSIAKEYLINTDKLITDIANECGYDNSCYFSKIFVASEKVSPSQYRKLLKNSKNHDKDVIYYSMLDHINLIGNLEISNLSKINNVKNHIVAMPSEKYAFLHEAAIIEYHGVLFAAWYNNIKNELTGETPIRFSCSCDGGQTWSNPTTVVNDENGKILYCPPVFGICDDKLYMFINQMVSPDHIHSLDLYIFDEKEKAFNIIWSKPIPFKLNTNVYTLPNGKLIIAGRVGEIDKFPNTPAVMISDSGKINDEWRIVNIQNDGNLADGSKFVFPEVSLIVNKKIYAFCRNDERAVPIVFVSEDFGETWSDPIGHDIPFSNTKIYSGTLTDKRNYVIGNLVPDRTKLAIFLSEPNTMKFVNGFIIQDGFTNEFGFGDSWHYPCAYENDGKLYVIYSVNINDWITRGAVISIIDITQI